jgi:hypothetical protein
VPEGNLAWDYEVPDPVMHLPEDEWAARVVVQTQQIMTVRQMGNFVRVILPVPVEHDRGGPAGHLAERIAGVSRGRFGGMK